MKGVKKKRQYSRKNQEFSDSFPHRVVGEVFRRQVLSNLRHSPRYNNDLLSVTVNSRQNNKTPLPFISIFSNINPSFPIFFTKQIFFHSFFTQKPISGITSPSPFSAPNF
ncbi:hypothetical protein Csa_010607, partial [Cucumis sativus]